MANQVYVFIALLTIAIVYVTTRAWEELRFRGKMLVTCPETHQAAAVKVSVGRAILKALVGRSGLFLTARRGLLTSDGVIGRDNRRS
jgi:hypothetical protein